MASQRMLMYDADATALPLCGPMWKWCPQQVYNETSPHVGSGPSAHEKRLVWRSEKFVVAFRNPTPVEGVII